MEALGLMLQFAAPFGLIRLGAGLDATSQGMRERRRAELLRTLPWPPEAGPLPPLCKVSGVVEDIGAFASPITGARAVALRYALTPAPPRTAAEAGAAPRRDRSAPGPAGC